MALYPRQRSLFYPNLFLPIVGTRSDTSIPDLTFFVLRVRAAPKNETTKDPWITHCLAQAETLSGMTCSKGGGEE